jgi:hypothetical protein
MIDIGLALLCPIVLGFIAVYSLIPNEKPLMAAFLSVGVGHPG